MNLCKPLGVLFTSVVCLGTAMAAENVTSATAPGQDRIFLVQEGAGTFSMTAHSGMPDNAYVFRTERGQRVELNPRAEVCFTMRTYKVKPTERLREGESGSMGQSTCQMGSNYKVRSADIPASK